MEQGAAPATTAPARSGTVGARTPPPGWLAAGGALAGLGAAAVASCCVLPLVLTLAGVGTGWTGRLAGPAAYRAEIGWAALLMVGLGWIVALRRRRAAAGTCRPDGACRAGPAWPTFGLLGLASLAVGPALTAPWWEPALQARLWAVYTGG